MDFWENLLRYPRFFISSCLGLILVILAPFRQLAKTRLSLIVGIILIVLTIGFVGISLSLMINSD